MTKKAVKTQDAPGAIGPYSQAVIAGGLVYVSGQIPINPETGEVVTASLAEQTRRVLENIKAVLARAGREMDDVVKTTVYLTDLAAFSEMNRVYGEFFNEPYPARATVEVSKLPKDVDVEIDAVACL